MLQKVFCHLFQISFYDLINTCARVNGFKVPSRSGVLVLTPLPPSSHTHTYTNTHTYTLPLLPRRIHHRPSSPSHQPTPKIKSACLLLQIYPRIASATPSPSASSKSRSSPPSSPPPHPPPPPASHTSRSPSSPSARPAPARRSSRLPFCTPSRQAASRRISLRTRTRRTTRSTRR